jgi:hypothetical protein
MPVESLPRAAVRIPRWVTAADVLCIVLLALILRSLAGDGYRISIGADHYISLRSWERLALWLAVLLAIRHYVWRSDPWHSRVVGWIRTLTSQPALRAAWPAFALSRGLVLIAAYVAVVSIGFRQPHTISSVNEFVDLYARFDGGWYFGIADDGYEDAGSFDPSVQNSIAFFPALPLLMRAAAVILDVNLWTGGVVVVTVAFLLGLVYLYRLARLDLPDEEARASLMLLALYPFGMCYSAVLTESVFLLAAAATFFYFRRAEYWKAAPFALLLGLLRPNGFLISVPLGLLAVLPFARSRGWLPGSHPDEVSTWSRLTKPLLIAALPVVGMLCYAAYVQSLTGDPFAFVKAQQAWGRGKAEIVNVVDDRSNLIAAEGLATYVRSFPIEVLESVTALFALAAVVPIVLRFGLAYGLFVGMAVLPPFITMGSISLGRYTAPLFPIFLWLGAAVPPRRRTYWLIAFAFGQALLSTLFFTSRPPY